MTYVQALSMSIMQTSSKHSIPYAIVLDVQQSEPKRKSKILVEVMTTKTKRVKQQATRIGKRQKRLLTIVESSEEEEEEEQEAKWEEKVTTFKNTTS